MTELIFGMEGMEDAGRRLPRRARAAPHRPGRRDRRRRRLPAVRRRLVRAGRRVAGRRRVHGRPRPRHHPADGPRSRPADDVAPQGVEVARGWPPTCWRRATGPPSRTSGWRGRENATIVAAPRRRRPARRRTPPRPLGVDGQGPVAEPEPVAARRRPTRRGRRPRRGPAASGHVGGDHGAGRDRRVGRRDPEPRPRCSRQARMPSTAAAKSASPAPTAADARTWWYAGGQAARARACAPSSA